MPVRDKREERHEQEGNDDQEIQAQNRENPDSDSRFVNVQMCAFLFIRNSESSNLKAVESPVSV